MNWKKILGIAVKPLMPSEKVREMPETSLEVAEGRLKKKEVE